MRRKAKTLKKNSWIGALVGLGLCAAAFPTNEATDETTASTQAVAQFGMQADNSETNEIQSDSTEYISTEISTEETTLEIVSTDEISAEYVPIAKAPTEPPTEPATEAQPETEAPTDPQTEPATEAPTVAPTEPPMVAEITTEATPVGRTVYITDSGEKYHRSGCRYLKDSKREISIDDAIAKGYVPCKVCDP